MCNRAPCEPRMCLSSVLRKILRNATSYNRAQLGVLEGCPLVLLGRVWEGLAPFKKAWCSWVYFRSCATYYDPRV